MTAPRVLFLQFTNAGNYPPLENAAHLLADAGAEVLFVEIEADRRVQLEMRPHPRIRHLRYPGGGARRYASFAVHATRAAFSFNPDWFYASDFLSAPTMLAIRQLKKCRIVYHEHDAPGSRGSWFTRSALRARRKLIDYAELLVIPAEGRRALLGPAGARAQVVWNCPRKAEVSEPAAEHDRVRLVYAGSLSPDRIPITYVHALPALPSNVDLLIYGYETRGFRGYTEILQQEAAKLGVERRLMINGAVDRDVLMKELPNCDIGIATLNPSSADPNLANMVGASCKSFDYLAAALPVLVSNTDAWERTFVAPGYGMSCDPTDAAAIATAIRPLLGREQRMEYGRRGRDRILRDWNYDHQFAPVMQRILG